MILNLLKKHSIEAVITVVVILAVFSYISIYKVSSHVYSLEQNLASTTEQLKVEISKNKENSTNDVYQLRQNVSAIEKKLGVYKEEVGNFSDTVTTLQKLSKTDPELLAKYSKIFFLNENYAPSRLTEVPGEYTYSDSKVLKVHNMVWPKLEEMIIAAKDAGVDIYVFSAYRSFNEQQALKQDYKVIYGAGTANQFSADQGYSEHQLGTTVDLITPGIGGGLDGFENTKAFTWLSANAYKYGFILSYPKNNKFYVYEPWHWRFVGVKLAKYLHNKGKNFYDMDQRDIDEYLVSIFD